MVVSTSSTLTREDIERIRALGEERWVRAALARDWDNLLALCAPEIVYMPPDQPALHGHHALREWLEQFPTILEFSQTLESVDGHANTAISRWAFTVKIDGGGQHVRNAGKSLAVVQKDMYGRWLTTAACFNWDQPMAPA